MDTSVTTNNENEIQTTSDGVSEVQRSQILTTQPADNNDIRTFSRTQKQKKNQQRRLRQILRSEDNYKSAPSFPKYYSIKFPRMNLEDANPIAIERDLKNKAGNFAEKIKKQNKDTLLVKVRNNQQGTNLVDIKDIASHEVIVSPHKSLNESKGTILSETMSLCSIDELMDTLHDQNVTSIERMKRKINGELVPTHRYILTFNTPDLPRTVRLSDWHYELVDMFIPTPMQCMKCQKLGHTKKWCRKENPTCSRCSEEGHHAQSCNNEMKCVNCTGSHRSTDKKCPHYMFKAEILATQTRLRCTFQDAEDKVKEQYREDGKSYSFALRYRRRQQPQEEENRDQHAQAATTSSQLQETEPHQTQRIQPQLSQETRPPQPLTKKKVNAKGTAESIAKVNTPQTNSASQVKPTTTPTIRALEQPNDLNQTLSYSRAAKQPSTSSGSNLPIPVIASGVQVRPATNTASETSKQSDATASSSKHVDKTLGAFPKTQTYEEDEWQKPKRRRQSISPKHDHPSVKKNSENRFDIIDPDHDDSSNYDYDDYAKDLYRTKRDKKSSPIYAGNSQKFKPAKKHKNDANRKEKVNNWI